MAAFGIATTDAEVDFDLNQDDVNPAELVKKYSTNHHKHYLNVNVVRNKHKANIAHMIQGIEERI